MTSISRTVLTGGLVADGLGGDPFLGDVVIVGDRIDAVVAAPERPTGGYDAEIIDCTGRVVAPGFVDIHCHSDLSLLAYPGNESRVTQGITTEVVGNCGMTPAPGNADVDGLARVISTIDVTPDLEWSWSDVAGWLQALDDCPTATNVAAHVGHGSARFAASGTSTAALDGSQLSALEREVQEAFSAGVVGASLGLMYAPGESAGAEELAAVARIVAAHDGVLSAHLRDYRTGALRRSIDELAGVAGDGGPRLQISHLRGVGGAGGFAEVLAHLETLRESKDIAADAYPYVHGHTTLLQLLPSQLRAAGPDAVVEACQADPAAIAGLFEASGYRRDQIIVMKAAGTPEAVGRDLTDSDGDPWRWLVDLLIANRGMVDVAVESGLWSDVDLTLATPWVSIASDGTALDRTHRASAAHPRSWGAFSAGYRRLRQHGTPIGEAVRRLSTAPASRVGITSGIRRGHRADLVVIDDLAFDAAATFAQPAQPSVGLDHVFVNGSAVVASGRPTGARPGALIRKRQQ
ncbi:N-acyl-D-amino-acid deacylase family protein [Agrococcus baldri]|uniref:N-acyl-D-amino-acid deacylase n=1 Tax=Agrococcus baldri TaxID=153730 RepID=A0AA87RCI0_9MICO|nr:amidohydrolase family protein [Agrococcus baldri]GEK80167.1 N-acyl-D-amino-acid deacylase [Agrococcus baldri]